MELRAPSQPNSMTKPSQISISNGSVSSPCPSSLCSHTVTPLALLPQYTELPPAIGVFICPFSVLLIVVGSTKGPVIDEE